jgi:nucleoside-diphosphate-sugar epimerase
MRVLVAGASGAIGTRLVPQLLNAGHEVIGSFNSPGNAERVRALGAEPIALANARFSRSLDRSFAQTNRLRTQGTDALLAAAREADVDRFVAQSFASTRYARVGGPVKGEPIESHDHPQPGSALDRLAGPGQVQQVRQPCALERGQQRVPPLREVRPAFEV